MTQRVVVGASSIVFLLVAVMAHLLVRIHDEGFPVELSPASRITLDFAEAAEGEAAMNLLRSVAAESGVELVRVTADLDGNLRGKLFVALDGTLRLPPVIDLYDQPPARVVGPEALAHISASGTYLVVGGAEHVPSFVAALEQHGVRVERADPSIGAALQSLLFVRGFLLGFIAACLMVATLALYWLAARAPSRALRVLGGTPVSRIQAHDLARLLILVGSGGLATLGGAALVVGLWKGGLYVPLFIEYFATLGALLLIVLGAAGLVLSWASIPSADLIARRQPATLGARRAADGLKGGAFVLLLLTIGPAWVVLSQAVTKAEALRRWETLADQVTMGFALLSEPEFERIMPSVGAVVRESEAGDGVALSWLFWDEPGIPGPWVSAALGGRWRSFAVVNRRWLDLVLDEPGRRSLERVPREQVPQSFIDAFAYQFSAWKRPKVPAEQLLAGYAYFTSRGDPIPVIGPGGADLLHLDDVLLIVVPGVWATFNDNAILSLASQGKLLFTGLDQTLTLIESHGLAREVKVSRAAEAGILAAQYASFDAWLGSASMVVLGAALVTAAGISAYLMALLRARNDFARRLAGQPWLRVLERRVLLDVLPGLGLAAVVAALQPRDYTLPILVVATTAALVSPAVHVLAARAVFAEVRARRL
ncbi:MAG TPA: hypothetical protein VNO86_08110 [Candidatus Binatia bacterium]|nr:hypothetical protein [Candidatus Binatia bacterium]